MQPSLSNQTQQIINSFVVIGLAWELNTFNQYNSIIQISNVSPVSAPFQIQKMLQVGGFLFAVNFYQNIELYVPLETSRHIILFFLTDGIAIEYN